MPRRPAPKDIKTRDQILAGILACTAPQVLKADRLAHFMPFLVKKRRLGSTWNDLTDALSDRVCRYSLVEIKNAVEPLVDDPAYDADAEIANRVAAQENPPPSAAPAAAAARPKKAVAA